MMFPVEPRGAVQASAATSGPSQELFRPLFWREREREDKGPAPRFRSKPVLGCSPIARPWIHCFFATTTTTATGPHNSPTVSDCDALRIGMAWHVPPLLLTCCRRPDQTDRPKAYPSGSGDRGPDPWMQAYRTSSHADAANLAASHGPLPVSSHRAGPVSPPLSSPLPR